MSQIIKLTESDLYRIINRVISEQRSDYAMDRMNNSLSNAVGIRPEKEYKVVEKTINDLSPQLQAKFQHMTFQETMEAIREFASGAKGIGVAVALDALGIGEIINPVFWILFLLYDIWLWFKKGVKNLFNIVIDIIGIITAGASTTYGKQVLGKLGNYLKGGVSSFVEGMAKETPQFFKWFSKLTKFFSTIISKVSTVVTETLPKLSQKLPMLSGGLNGMKGMLGSLKGFLLEIEQSVAKFAGEEFSHEAQHLAKHYGKHYAEHEIAHDVVGAAVGHGGEHVAKKVLPKMVAQKGKQTVKPLTTRNSNYKQPTQNPNRNIA
jgi:hypothetical protein